MTAQVNPTSALLQSTRTTSRTGALVRAPRGRADLTVWKRDVAVLRRHGHDLLRVALPSWLLAPAAYQWSPGQQALHREALAYARERGFVLNVVVPGAPDWAQHYAHSDYVGSCDWFWRRLDAAFGDQVGLWQVFNEADTLHYRLFTPVELGDSYLQELAGLLRRARGIFRTATTTNLTGWPMNDQREQAWVHVLDHLVPTLDRISLNVYPADNALEIERLPDRLERIRDRYGQRILISELGLQTAPGTWTEADQGTYLSRTIRELRVDALWGVCIYELRDEPAPEPAGFGLLREDGSPKSGFEEIMKALRALRSQEANA